MKIDHISILKINKNWLPVALTSVEKVFPDMMTRVVAGMHTSFERGEDGEYDFTKPTEAWPVPWDEWIKLPIREYDDFITTPKMRIRIPKIVISTYGGMPLYTPKLTKDAVMARDGYTCSYTGKVFTAKEARKHLNIDHVVPRSRGGKSSWENLVTCSKEINSAKADKTPHEAGLKLLKSPRKPIARPMAFRAYQDNADPQWAWLTGK